MDRKTKHDYNKTILMMERMGLKNAAQKLEENLNEAFSISAYEAGMQDAKEGLKADASRTGHESFEKDYMDGYEDGLPEGELKEKFQAAGPDRVGMTQRRREKVQKLKKYLKFCSYLKKIILI